MAANVALSKPSSILTAFPWIHLPFELTWIEMANMDLRHAMSELGSPNIMVPESETQIERTGFLIWEERDDNNHYLVIDYVHRDRIHNKSMTDLAPIRIKMNLKGKGVEDFEEFPELLINARNKESLLKSKGKMRDHLKLLTNDTEQYFFEKEIMDRFTWENHPDMKDMRVAFLKMAGEQKVLNVEERQANEAIRLFKVFGLPALILLNCKNAISTEEVSTTSAQKRTRRLRGKKPLVDHKIVKVKLTASQKRKTERDYEGSSENFIRGTLVTGHFKVRKTGIFWWSPHARMGYGAITKRRIVTT